MAIVTIVQGDTLLTPDQGPTYGSLSIQIGGMQIRHAAAATAKRALLVGARRIKLRMLASTDRGRRRSAREPAEQVSYGELIGGKQFSLDARPQKPPATKDPKTFTIVGKPRSARLDIPDKVTGKFTYMQDFRVPGMLHGRVVRPPAIGAELQSVDESVDQGIPGIVRIVREGNFLGVVAENEWAAIKASQRSRRPGRPGRDCPIRRSSSTTCAPRKVAKDEVTSNIGNAADAHGQGGVQEDQRHLRIRHPHPWFDRSVLRDRRIQGRQADILDGVAGDPQSAQAAREDVRCCRSRMCAASMSKAPAATAATDTKMPPPMRRCSPRRSAGRCACNGRAPTSMAGIRRDRRHWSICGRRSKRPAP